MAYASKCVKTTGLTVTGISVMLWGHDGFESECPETKFQTITS